ncbi:MAG TPA: bifunctional homocysteine S-methyltransferase/methylenetetrahydrofolate reductase [Chloroflexia bacterium]|nr:bifunctional homocysteine S-methyltransferase/methylenetetrahydrofolate reductase [Chloroflexia bacterium]
MADNSRPNSGLDHPFLARLREPGPIICDGAMGTMLYSLGVPANSCFDEANLSQPEVVKAIHEAYIAAGADIIETNTYGANRFKLTPYELGDKVRKINSRGARLAREVREVSGRPVLVAGAVGPLGKPIRPVGMISETEARDYFKEQIEALLEGGVDLLILETFRDLEEMKQALMAAREVSDLPVVTQMTFEEDGRTQMGNTPEEVVRELQALGADVIGANCSTGPQRMARVISEMISHAGTPISAQPNAGWPEMVNNRVVYVSTPDYMAAFARRMLDGGARILGGCCGTTPAHIKAIADALRSTEPVTEQPAPRPIRRSVASLRVAEQEAPMLREAAPLEISEQRTSVHSEPGSFGWKLGKEFVVSVELAPPRGVNPTKLLAGAEMLRARGVDAVNVTDSALGRASMSALAVCYLVLQQTGMTVIPHFTTRDRTLMGIQSELLGAHAMGLRHILALTGDAPNPVDRMGSSAVFDIDSIGLVKLLSTLNEGLDLAGNSIGGTTDYLIGCAFNPTARDISQEKERLAQKLEAGAHFIMTQPVYDLDLVERTLEHVKDFDTPVLLGILPLQSYRHAEFLHNEVPGIVIPEFVLARMFEAGPNGRQAGLEMAQEILLHAHTRYAGVYLMPSFGRYELCASTLDVLPRFAPTAAPAELESSA